MGCTSSAQHGPKRADVQAESGKLLLVTFQNLALSQQAWSTGRYCSGIWEQHTHSFARTRHLDAGRQKTVLSLEVTQLVYTNS